MLTVYPASRGAADIMQRPGAAPILISDPLAGA
ncbi:MAG: hypothetical protein ACI9R8_002629, partial [Candidatus Paceibacteria bacterium]